MDSPLRPCPHQILLKMVTFFLRFKKYVPCRKYVSHENATPMEIWQNLLLSMLLGYDVCFLFFVCPHVDEKPMFSKVFTLETVFEKIIFTLLLVTTFEKMCFDDCFHQIRVDDRPSWRKKISVFKQKWIHVDEVQDKQIVQAPIRCLSKKELTVLPYIIG